MPKGIPLLACTATATIHIRHQVIQTLQMENCAFVQASPDRPNIYYKVHRCTDISTDFNNLVKSLKQLSINAPRVIVYRRTLDMCAYLYSHFCMSWEETPTTLRVLKSYAVISYLACITPVLHNITKR